MLLANNSWIGHRALSRSLARASLFVSWKRCCGRDRAPESATMRDTKRGWSLAMHAVARTHSYAITSQSQLRADKLECVDTRARIPGSRDYARSARARSPELSDELTLSPAPECTVVFMRA